MLCVTFDRAEATARGDASAKKGGVVCLLKRKQKHGWTCPQSHENSVSVVLLNSFKDCRETG